MSVTEIVAFACLLVPAMVGFPETGSAQSANKQPAPAKADEASVVDASLGNAKNVHRLNDLFFSGQFSREDIQQIKKARVGRVITLRTDGELDWDERSAVEAAGLQFEQVPVGGADALTDEVFDKVRRLLKDKSQPTLLHCGSANRVGGVWLTRRVLDEGVDVRTAIEEAKTIGLRSPAIQKKALDYIQRKKTSGAEE